MPDGLPGLVPRGDFAPVPDHERRLRSLEESRAQFARDIHLQRLAHQELVKDLFGDKSRADDGGQGAFKRLEGLLSAMEGRLTTQIGQLSERLTAHEEGHAAVRARWSDRRWAVTAAASAVVVGGVANALLRVATHGAVP